jgi:hypothetical protein
VAASSLQEIYVRLLLDRIQEEKFPNPDHLDRIEAALTNPDQLREYVTLLLDKGVGYEVPQPSVARPAPALRGHAVVAPGACSCRRQPLPDSDLTAPNLGS